MLQHHWLLGSCLLATACLLSLSPPTGAAGAGWNALPNAPIATRHEDVFFVSPDLGWIVNAGGNIYRTSDGGNHWELQWHEPVYFRSLGFANALKGWAGTLGPDPPLLYATTDGGAAWTPVLNIPPPLPTGICGIWVVNASVAYACGRYDGPARVIKTTNGGITWTSTDLNPLANTLIDCYFFDENTGFVVGGIGPTFSTRRAVILATTNGGTTWETRYTTDRTAEWCWKISFLTPTTGFVSIERNIGPAFFLSTKDGGRTWKEVFFINDYDEQGIGFATPTLGWIGGWSGPTYETTDAGASWHPAGFGQMINRFRFLDQTLGFAVGETVYKYSAGVAGVTADTSPESPSDWVLAQNHPNPFSRSTSIPYALARHSEVKLTIHDAQGRRIRTLQEGRRPPGRHELAWNGRDDSGSPVGAGVYFYRLETVQGSQTEVRKLLVIK